MVGSAWLGLAGLHPPGQRCSSRIPSLPWVLAKDPSAGDLSETQSWPPLNACSYDSRCFRITAILRMCAGPFPDPANAPRKPWGHPVSLPLCTLSPLPGRVLLGLPETSSKSPPPNPPAYSLVLGDKEGRQSMNL